MIAIGIIVSGLLMVPVAPFLCFGRFRYGGYTLACLGAATLISWMFMRDLYLVFAEGAGLQPGTDAYDQARTFLNYVYIAAGGFFLVQLIDAAIAKPHPASFGSSSPVINRQNGSWVTFEIALIGATALLGFFLSNNHGPQYFALTGMALGAVVPRLILGLFVKRSTGNLRLLGDPAKKIKPNIAALAPMPKSSATGGVAGIISRRPLHLQSLEKD